MYRLRMAALGVVDAGALVLLRPDVHALRTAVDGPRAWVTGIGPDRAVATLAGCALWLVALRVAVGLVALALSRFPGTLGRAADALARVALPAVVRRVVIGTAGLSVLLVPLAAQARGVAPSARAATPTSSWSAPADPVPGPAWPSSVPAPTPLPGPAWPRPPATHPPATHPPATHRVDRTPPAQERVEVRDGDCLWMIAAHRAGPDASERTVADDVARLYATNRQVVGADPDLVRPGQVLDVPSPRAPESP